MTEQEWNKIKEEVTTLCEHVNDQISVASFDELKHHLDRLLDLQVIAETQELFIRLGVGFK
jgi:hypothetical protein